MSTLAKILVVFNLVLAVVFFGVEASLFSMRYNWREALEEYRQTATTEMSALEEGFQPYKKQLSEVKASNAKLAADVSNLQAGNQKLTVETANLTSELSSIREENKGLVARDKEKEDSIQGYTQTIANLNEQIDELRAEQSKAVDERKAAVVAYTSLSVDLAKTQEELSTALASLQTEKAKIDKYEVQIARAAQNGYKLEDFLSPHVEGIVEAVSNEENIVVLSVGKEQKVEHGHLFAVRRGGDYIGKVRVIDVYQDLSGARVEYTREGTPIQVGDQVETFRQ